MSDEADRANEINELVLAKQVAHREPVLPAIGVCHYCGEPVPGSAKFCDKDCRDDHEREQRLLRLNGRK